MRATLRRGIELSFGRRFRAGAEGVRRAPIQRANGIQPDARSPVPGGAGSTQPPAPPSPGMGGSMPGMGDWTPGTGQTMPSGNSEMHVWERGNRVGDSR